MMNMAAISRLSALGSRLSALGSQQSAIGYRLSAISSRTQKGPDGGDAIRASVQFLWSCGYAGTMDDTAWRTEAWPPKSQHMQVIIINTMEDYPT
ncbi:MAG: hypothetical protein Q8L86_11365 [Vicinamibacterales bacterium]|nr:hypothetical protein [Vicinamibacterales bacterium]